MRKERSGFTLIELLVVITLILVLATISVMFVPNIQGQQRAAQGGTMLQSWLAIAKQKALRDQAPGGLRLLPGTTFDPNLGGPNPLWVTEMLFLEQPEDLNAFNGNGMTGTIGGASTSSPIIISCPAPHGLITGLSVTTNGVTGISGANGIYTITVINANQFSLNGSNGVGVYAGGGNWRTNGLLSAPGATNNVLIAGIDLFNGYAYVPADMPFWSIQPNDYLEIMGTGLVQRIVDIQPVPLAATSPIYFYQLTLASPVRYAIGSTTNFRIIRQPRPVTDGEKLVLPADIAIDLTTNFPSVTVPPIPAGYDNPLVGNSDGSFDILFAPSGRVIGKQAGARTTGYGNDAGVIVLWVRDITMPIDAGTPTLMGIFTGSGLGAAHPVDPSNGFTPGTARPYTFLLDGKSSGL